MMKIIEDEEICQKIGTQCSKADFITDLLLHCVYHMVNRE